MAQLSKTDMSELWDSSAFYGESADWLESMYETYLSNPDKLEARWRLYFDNISVSNQSRSNGDGHAVNTSNREISDRKSVV